MLVLNYGAKVIHFFQLCKLFCNKCVFFCILFILVGYSRIVERTRHIFCTFVNKINIFRVTLKVNILFCTYFRENSEIARVARY